MRPPLFYALLGLPAAAALPEQSRPHPMDTPPHHILHQHQPKQPQLIRRTAMNKWRISPVDVSPTINCSPSVKKIRLQSTTGKQIQMLEFRVYSSDVNIAPNATASQSSLWNDDVNYAASMAIDGSNTTFSYTNDSNAFWELDLDRLHSIQRLEILTRYCGSDPTDPKNCTCRLSNATLSLFDENDQVLETRTFGNTCHKLVLADNFALDTACPTVSPTGSPNEAPSRNPSKSPTRRSTDSKCISLTTAISTSLTASPTESYSQWPTASPSKLPTLSPTNPLSTSPTKNCSSNIRKVRLESTSGEQIQMFELSAYTSGVNVALKGSARQSSVLKENNKYAAFNAIDGDGTTFCHTSDNKAYWEVDLNGLYKIESVVINNRWCASPSDVTGCLCRLSSARLLLLDETNAVVAARSLGNTCGMLIVSQSFESNPSCLTLPPSRSPSKAPSAEPTMPPSKTPTDTSSVRPSMSSSSGPTATPTRSPTQSPSIRPTAAPSTSLSNSPTKSYSQWPTVSSSKSPTLFPRNPPSTSPTTTCSSYVRKVRLESTSGKQIQMFELSAYSSGVNVALQGSAKQSSVLKDNNKYAAFNAIDGDGTTFCHTSDTNAYWELDLNGLYKIESVVISNRWCASPSDVTGCLCRISSARLLLLDETNAVVAARSLGNTCGMLIVSESFESNPSCLTLPPSKSPSKTPSAKPTMPPSKTPTDTSSVRPSVFPSSYPSSTETVSPIISPSRSPTLISSQYPSISPSVSPTKRPSASSSAPPSSSPSHSPSHSSDSPFVNPTTSPSHSPSKPPSASPSMSPTMSNSPSRQVIHAISVSSERNVNLSVSIGECSDPVTGVGYSLGSILSLCIKTPDSDVVVSGLKDVYLTDSDGNDILLIVDGYGRTSFTSSLDGIGSSSVDLSTLMSSTVYDQGYGGTSIDVRGTVMVAYVSDIDSRTLRKFERSVVSSFTIEFVVGEAAKKRPQIVDEMMHSPSAAGDQHSIFGAYISVMLSALVLNF
ncbi:hypothetical protein HJC23_009461 [Cyclotella cryptica]|uniref:Uncharacterized protein n=1 Tax=Cyclotella cryptica TaxID=29204 RepID=A0ABD3Q0W2_9STRA